MLIFPASRASVGSTPSTPGEEMAITLDHHLPPRTGWAGIVPRGQRLRVVEVDGGQIGDFVVFNAANLRERFDQARTKANQGRLLITKGHVLYSKSNNVLMSIT